uniref:Uncharacterized protein n=1 Tax=Arundo donax TaxID=35708 RepID=A0A0A9AMR2_ARUDO
METAAPQPTLSKAWRDCDARYSDLHDSCCQIHTIGGRICSAVISITSDIASNICSTGEQLNYSEQHLNALARFCAFQLAKILVDNKFSWDSITVHFCALITLLLQLCFLISISGLISADVKILLFGRALSGSGCDVPCVF